MVLVELSNCCIIVSMVSFILFMESPNVSTRSCMSLLVVDDIYPIICWISLVK